jgi:probable phosphoglycerate mutase
MSALPGTTGRRRLYLMRHGHVDYFSKTVIVDRRPDLVPLTELGRAQADAAGRALGPIRFDLALCSGYPRTRQTAERVLALNEDGAHLTLEDEPDLVEIKGGGLIQARSREELSARMAFEFDRAHMPGAAMFGGDKFADVQARSVRAVERLLARPDWHTALIVAHEGVNRLLLSWATGAGLQGASRFEQDLACVNILDFDLVPLAGEKAGTEIARTIIKMVNVTPYNFLKHGMNLTSLEAIFQLGTEGAA